MPMHQRFNQSALSRFLNSSAGRAARLLAGTAFLVTGWLLRTEPAGIAAMAWSVFPLTAGVFDLCYVSALLGGPLKGSGIADQVSVH